jgi:hypothetical protein
MAGWHCGANAAETGVPEVLHLICPHCRKTVRVTNVDAGKTVACPVCTLPFSVPQTALFPNAVHDADEHERLTKKRLPAEEPEYPKWELNRSARSQVRRLSFALRIIRLRLSARATFDQMRLGTGTGERLCAALILGVFFFLALLVVSLIARFETQSGLLLAGGALVAIFIPNAILILGSSDESLETNRRQMELRLGKARELAAIERADAEGAAALAAEHARRKEDWDERSRIARIPANSTEARYENPVVSLVTGIGGGILVCALGIFCIGVCAPVGAAFILAGLVLPFYSMSVGTLHGPCPFCGHQIQVTGDKPGFTCKACQRRSVVRAKYFVRVD